jgi:hypothetical protein
LQEQPDKADDPIWQMGMHRHLREIGQIIDVESRLSRYQLLTDAWIEGVLHTALDKTIDLRMARDESQSSNLVFHRPQGVETRTIRAAVEPTWMPQRLIGRYRALYGLISGLYFWLIGIMMAFLDIPSVDKRPKPDRGVFASLRNALLMTTLAAFLFGLPACFFDHLFEQDLIIRFLALVNILPPAFTWFGGLAWCQHWALWFMLARRGWLPWRLLPWLDEMVARGLLRRVGGGYIFIHRSLLEYFAALEDSQTFD